MTKTVILKFGWRKQVFGEMTGKNLSPLKNIEMTFLITDI